MNNNDSTRSSKNGDDTVIVHADDNDARIKHDAELLADFLYRLFKESRGC